MNKITLTVKETAALIGVSTTTIYAMVREKQIPHVRVRSSIIFHRERIEGWLIGSDQGRQSDESNVSGTKLI